MVNFDIIQGTVYSCEADAGIMAMKKNTLDYHTQNIGNPAKSNLTPAKLKLLELDYETSKKKYDASPCVKNKDPERDKCITLQQRIESLKSTVTYFYSVRDNESAIRITNEINDLKKEFDDSKCGAKIGEFRADTIKSITDVYSEMDKKRIEEQSKYQAKQRIFFGALVVLGAVLMVTMFGKKE
jgi:hypothetical protein